MDKTSESFINKISKLCYDEYSKLSKTGKPNENEWTLLSAFILEYDNNIEIVSMATGTKCLGESELNNYGNLIHDSHAEVLARRGFILFLYNEISIGEKSKYFTPSNNKFRFRENIKLYLFSSRTPCGDASIIPMQPFDYNLNKEPIRKNAKLDIYRTGGKCVNGEVEDPKMIGIDYHAVESLRTKPGRGERTRSLSCSDKIAKWCLLGVQGSIAMLLLEKPIYIDAVIIGDSPFSENSMKRGLFERFEKRLPKLDNEYYLHKPAIFKCNLQFIHGQFTSQRKIACGAAIIWWKSCLKQEVIVNGIKLGTSKKNRNTVKCWSRLCKIEMFKVVKPLLISLCSENVTYEDIKHFSKCYQKNWETLLKTIFKNWPQTVRLRNNFKV